MGKIETEYIKDTKGLARAAAILRSGGLVAVPTETVYGLAANGLDPAAVERIYEVKGRPAVKPLSLLVEGVQALDAYGRNVSRGAKVLASAFWPGPLTIVVEADLKIPEITRAGGATVGLRCPKSEKTLQLLKLCGLPFAAPSANLSGQPSPKTAEEAAAYFDGAIEAIVDDGPCLLGTESTIVDMTVRPYRILRRGALSADAIRGVLIGSLRVVGVTGGTGAGKTTALDSLAAMGALVIDADKVYHDLCLENRDMLAEIEARFPGSVEDGVLQRKALGAVVFSDPKALADLSSITDKYVIAAIDGMLADHAAAGGRYAAIDAVNLLGTSLEDRLTALVGVLAPEDVRVSRLAARDGISEEYARMRIRAQKPDAFYEAHCNYILRNGGGREDFRAACDKLFKNILEDKSHG